MFENFRSPSVREPYAGYVLELLDALGPVAPLDRPCLLLHPECDIRAILDGTQGLKAGLSKSELRYVTSYLHLEIQHDHAFICNEVLAVTAGWLNDRWGKAQVA